MEMAGPAGGGIRDAVVLVNGADGAELEAVREMLTRLPRTPTVLVSRADFDSAALSLDLGTGLLDLDGQVVRPAVVWLRHSSACALAAQARPAGSLSLIGAAAWSWLLGPLAAAAAVSLPGSAPAGPGQLPAAARLGVRTPRTVLSTDVAAARKQLDARRTIVKTPDFRLYQPDRRQWAGLLPRVVDDGSPACTADWSPGRAAPVVVQEYYGPVRELRVFYLNGGICAFQVDKPDPAAVWTDPAGVTVTATDCPAAAAALVRTLCAAWKLRYGAFDLLLPTRGEPVFLEVNPDGDWLWYERKAGWHGVSFMAAAMVHELFVRITSTLKGGCS
jgi:hypothetical protein